MIKPKISSGAELVTHGDIKLNISLPEVGLKEVLPKGTWLERKQIQAALLAIKQLIEVERIEKCGSLSTAEWDGPGAPVIVQKQCGPHWQYVGHSEGGRTTLLPEETIFLMETGNLRVSRRGRALSLQEARAGLWGAREGQEGVGAGEGGAGEGEGERSRGYALYAELARAGHKLFRPQTASGARSNTYDCSSEVTSTNCEMEIDREPVAANSNALSISESCHNADSNDSFRKHNNHIIDMIQKLYQRNHNIVIMSNSFDGLPECLGKDTVSVRSPLPALLPPNVAPLSSPCFSVSLRPAAPRPSPPLSPSAHSPPCRALLPPPLPPLPSRGCYRPLLRPPFYSYVRPPFYYRMYFSQHSYGFPRPQLYGFPRRFPIWRAPRFFYGGNITTTVRDDGTFTRKRLFRHGNVEIASRLAEIEKLAKRIRDLIALGSDVRQSKLCLEKLVLAYNDMYKKNLVLDENFELINLDTIDLEATASTSRSGEKRRRTSKRAETPNDNLNVAKELAKKLRAMEAEGTARPRHRRAFSNMLKTYNESYGASLYLDDDYEIRVKDEIVVESSSDSDCVVEEPPPETGPGMVAAAAAADPGPSHEPRDLGPSRAESRRALAGWLPPDEDFGRAELVPSPSPSPGPCAADSLPLRLQHACWRDAKLAFWRMAAAAEGEQRRGGRRVGVARPRGGAGAGAGSGGGGGDAAWHVYVGELRGFRKTQRPPPAYTVTCYDARSALPALGARGAVAASAGAGAGGAGWLRLAALP